MDSRISYFLVISQILVPPGPVLACPRLVAPLAAADRVVGVVELADQVGRINQAGLKVP